MDNHPIPQDVTGFQFKLVGNMTIKQFGYVACGVILAVILYYLPIDSAIGIAIKTLLIPLFGISGFLLAFLPIEGRPIDVMIGNFIKALFSPNQYVYHKTGRLFDFSHLPSPKPSTATAHVVMPSRTDEQKLTQLRQLIQRSHVQKTNKLDERETTFLQSLSSTPIPSPSLQLQPQPVVTQPSTPPPVPPPPPPQAQQEMKQTSPTSDALAKEEHLLAQQLEQAKKDEQTQQTTGVTDAAHQKVTLLERQVQALHFQRQQLEQQLQHLQNQLAHQKAVPQPAAPTANSQQAAQPAQKTQQQDLSKRGLPHVPDTPNVIVGLVKDPRGNVLPNILVEVKDKDGNPVRAFKTNALGQFASATPLAPGNYTVELEDPKKQNRFNVIQLAATNQILLPIEIISHDAREELRKQLFN